MLEGGVEVVASHAIVVLMSTVGLGLGRDAIARVRAEPLAVVRALAVVWLVVPAVAVVAVRLLDPPAAATVALLAVAISPGAPVVALSARRAGGAAGTAVVVLAATAVTAPLFMPVWATTLSLVFEPALSVGPVDVLRVAIGLVLAPLAAGVCVRAAWPRVADPLARLGQLAFAIGLVAILVALMIAGRGALADLDAATVVAAAAVTATAIVIGRAATGGAPAARRSVAAAAALGNPALALAIVAGTFPHARDAGALIAAYLLARALALVAIHAAARPRAARAPGERARTGARA